jgi:hypothetical protein
LNCSDITIIRRINIKDSKPIRLGIKILKDKVATDHINPFKLCFNESTWNEDYLSYFKELLSRLILMETIVDKVNILDDSTKFKLAFVNKIETKEPKDSIRDYDYLLLIDYMAAGFDPAHYETGTSNAMGTKTSGWEHKPGEICQSATVFIYDCKKQQYSAFGGIYSCKITNQLSKADLLTFPERMIKELFGSMKLLRKT